MHLHVVLLLIYIWMIGLPYLGSSNTRICREKIWNQEMYTRVSDIYLRIIPDDWIVSSYMDDGMGMYIYTVTETERILISIYDEYT